jgi:hypothetical protein
MRAPPQSALCVFACTILLLCVVSSDVERAHTICKDNRTKDRNALTYDNNQALTFAKLELIRSERSAKLKKPVRLSWSELVQFSNAMGSLTDKEEAWVDALDAKWKAEEATEAEAAAASAESEVDAPAVDAPAAAQDEGDSATTVAHNPEGEVPISGMPDGISKRGRRRIKKPLGPDYARFDYDGAVRHFQVD